MKKSIDDTLFNEAVDRQLIDTVQTVLNQEAEHLDAASLSRLRQAREKALQIARDKRNSMNARYKYIFPVALTASLLIAVMIFKPLLTTKQDSDAALVVNDDAFELLASGDSMDFYADLEFYQWLALQENAG